MAAERVMPDDLANGIGYLNEGRQGDGFPCRLRLDYLDMTKDPPVPDHFGHSWKITATEWDPLGPEQQTQLEAEKRARYTDHLLGRIRATLHKTKTILVREGTDLVRRAV